MVLMTRKYNTFFGMGSGEYAYKKEKEILKLILKNDKRKVIADKLYVSENTIKKHTASIFRKLKTKSRDELFSECKKILNEGTQG